MKENVFSLYVFGWKDGKEKRIENEYTFHCLVERKIYIYIYILLLHPNHKILY